MFNQINLYTVLIQGIHIIFTDQMSAFHVVRKVHSVLALRRYLNTQSFYSVDEFFMCKNGP